MHRRIFCDSIRMDPEFKPRDGARGQNLGHFCKAVNFLNAYISIVSRQKKHSYLEHVYVHAIFIQVVHGHLCFINKLKGFFRCKVHLCCCHDNFT